MFILVLEICISQGTECILVSIGTATNNYIKNKEREQIIKGVLGERCPQKEKKEMRELKNQSYSNPCSANTIELS